MIFPDQLYDPNCSLGADGLYPHPKDNTKYIKCIDGHASVEHCINGMIFSKTRKYCDYESKVYEYDSEKNGYNTLNEDRGITNVIRKIERKLISFLKASSSYSH